MNIQNSILIDTKLLVLLIVGTTDKSLIKRHKRTREFAEEDYDLLCQILDSFSTVLVTPNVWTEACNLSRQIGDPNRTQISASMSNLIRGSREEYVSSKEACSDKNFIRLGLADSGILRRAGIVRCVLTYDFNLYQTLLELGHKALNFNHVRMQGWHLF